MIFQTQRDSKIRTILTFVDTRTSSVLFWPTVTSSGELFASPVVESRVYMGVEATSFGVKATVYHSRGFYVN
jgi:hypothetical protein